MPYKVEISHINTPFLMPDKVGISHINTLLIMPNKVGISHINPPYNAQEDRDIPIKCLCFCPFWVPSQLRPARAEGAPGGLSGVFLGLRG